MFEVWNKPYMQMTPLDFLFVGVQVAIPLFILLTGFAYLETWWKGRK